MDRLPPPTADFDLQLFSDPWRIVVLVGDSIVGSASLLPILTICLTPVESREVYHNENDDRPGESQLHHDEGGRGGVDGAKGQRQ